MAGGADGGVGRDGADAGGWYDESEGANLKIREVGVLVSCLFTITELHEHKWSRTQRRPRMKCTITQETDSKRNFEKTLCHHTRFTSINNDLLLFHYSHTYINIALILFNSL